MSEKKGVELPGREGRWEEASIESYDGDRKALWLADKWPGTENLVVYRRIDPPPFPRLVVGDAIRLGTANWVVIEPDQQRCADENGRWVVFSKPHVLEVWREGKIIWRRPA